MKTVNTILVCAAIGGLAAWLFTSKSGRKFLSGIKETTNDLSDSVKSGLNTVKETTNDLINKGKSYVTDANNAVQESL